MISVSPFNAALVSVCGFYVMHHIEMLVWLQAAQWLRNVSDAKQQQRVQNTLSLPPLPVARKYSQQVEWKIDIPVQVLAEKIQKAMEEGQLLILKVEAGGNESVLKQASKSWLFSGASVFFYVWCSVFCVQCSMFGVWCLEHQQTVCENSFHKHLCSMHALPVSGHWLPTVQGHVSVHIELTNAQG